MFLSISIEELNDIELNFPTSVIRFMKVFQYWKKSQCAPFTWNKVIDILRSDTLRENALADKLTRTLQAQLV